MNLDDPKLTAYALEEFDLLDAADRAEVEAWLTTSPEGRQFVAETRQIATLLSEKLHVESAPALTDEQRAAILGGSGIPDASDPVETTKSSRDAASTSPSRIRRVSLIAALSALAACLLSGPFLPWAEILGLYRQQAATVTATNEAKESEGFHITMENQPTAPSSPPISAPFANSTSSTFKLEGKDTQLAFDAPPPNQRIAAAPAKSAVPDTTALFAEAQKLIQQGKYDEALEILRQILRIDPVNLIARTEIEKIYKLRTVADNRTDKLQQYKDEERLDAAAQQLQMAAPLSAPRPAPGIVNAPFSRSESAKAPPASAGGNMRALGRESYRGNLAFADERAQTGVARDAVRDNDFNTEAYDSQDENPFLDVKGNPLSTFSIDVDTASYANVRRFINQGQLPPKGAVRIEEMLNYFSYDYPGPTDGTPFSTSIEAAECPWQPEHRLVRIGLRGRDVPTAERPAGNLVFLIDISGSMDEPNKLPLLKQSLRMLVDQLRQNDHVAIAVYAGQSGLALPSTSDKQAIKDALDHLQPGGSTNGASGIQTAYAEAQRNFIKGGVNRVILATDGDFNVGVTSQSDLVDLIQEKAKTGVFLSVLGFGEGNLKDSTMEKLADKGNGNYAYIDSVSEGRKVLVEQLGGTLVTIAKDVKIQVEFNPDVVAQYRLIGYENRLLAKEDFNDDKKDAGEIGANHTVTALYEVVPVGKSVPMSTVDALKYQAAPPADQSKITNQKSKISEMLTVKLRYKQPAGDTSTRVEFPFTDNSAKLAAATPDFRFGAAVAEAGLLLKDSAHKQLATWDSSIELASQSLVDLRTKRDARYREEFLDLARKARDLSQRHED